MEVSSIKVIHKGSVSTDKYEHVFQKPNETAVLVKSDGGPSENAVQQVNSSSNFLRGHSDDTHREVKVEPKPTNARAYLSLTSNSCSKPPI
jgi:negative regulator of sigma E activity